MTRREKILAYVKSQAGVNTQGLTTLAISEALGIIRSNVSKELNALVRENILQKSTGRPVRYLLAGTKTQSTTQNNTEK